MGEKMKGEFFPKYYCLPLFKQVQNLKKKMMTMREYTEEFYQVKLRACHVEDTPKKTTRYINGLRLEIQHEINILSPRTIKDAYQCALKAEENIEMKQNSSRGRGFTRGRGQSTGKENLIVQKNDEGSSNQHGHPEKEGGSRRERPYQRDRGIGRGRKTAYRCYRGNTLGHRPLNVPRMTIRDSKVHT